MEATRRGFLKGVLATMAVAASGASLVIPAEASAVSLPNGWLLCNGQAVSKSAYADLYRVIAGAYGETDGTFYLPDVPASDVDGYSICAGIAPDRSESGVVIPGMLAHFAIPTPA